MEYSQINIFVALNVLIEGVCFVGENSPHLEGFSHGTKSFLCDSNGQKAPRSFPEDSLRWNKIIASIFIVDVSIDWSISKVIINTKALFYTLFFMEASDEFWCFTRITAQNKNIFSNERIILNS